MDTSGGVLPGVTVTVASVALQGTRHTTTSPNGDYILPFLPPGGYSATFELSGFRKLESRVRVAVAETVLLNVQLVLSGVAETVTVSGDAGPAEFSQGAAVAASYKSQMIDRLPVDRDLRGAALLAPGTYATGPNNNITISGALSYEGLFLMNGVVLNDTFTGQPRSLFIEDAVEETKIMTGKISAEYGRFSGGVVNALTKSGGNDFGGSLRVTFNNDDWRSLTPLENALATAPRVDKIVPTYEATLGGPFVRDKLWFFAAGRFENNKTSQTLAYTNVPYQRGENEKRYEGKLTWSITPKHTLKTSYTRLGRDVTNTSMFDIMDLASLFETSTPQSLVSANYTAILSPRLFVEAQYSRRRLSMLGVGSRFTDLLRGTVILDRSRDSARWNSPTLCGVCGAPEGKLREAKRDNQNVIVKGSYFLSTAGAGSHNISFGLDAFEDSRKDDNWGSGSGFWISAPNALIRGEQLFPVFTPRTTFIQWRPVLQTSVGSELRTYSAFLNDTWRLSKRWSFNLGVRWDKNDAKDQSGTRVADHGTWSPRLSASFDPTGDGKWTVNGGLARYAIPVTSGIADLGSAAGRQSIFQYDYLGPSINADLTTTNPTPADQALRQLFDWFFANGATDRPLRGTPTYPGVNRVVGEDLVLPSAWEGSLGFSRRLGSKGLLRIDGLWREYRDFFAEKVDATTGKATDPRGGRYDMAVVGNTNEVARRYRGVSAQIHRRFFDHLTLAGNYTLSQARGNFDGERAVAGPVPSEVLKYPEYKEPRWNEPVGDLAVDQRHKARLWAVFDAKLPVGVGRLDLGVLERIDSGTPYSSDGVIDSRPYVRNPGYDTPPAMLAYYFGGRSNFRTETLTATDVSLNYSLPVGLTKKSEVFARVVINNLFSESAQVVPGNETVFTLDNDPTLQPFNPFTETPVEGVHFRLGPQFGKAIASDDYQSPRSFFFAVGFRF